MRIVAICLLGLLLVGCGGAAVDLPTETPAPPAAPAETLPPPTVGQPTAVPVADLIAEGDAFVEQGRLEEAIRVYQRAVSLDHENAAAHNALGVAHGLAGQFEQAEFELLEAIRLAPENGTVHSNLCDPLGENDEDTAMICAITENHASRDSFVEYFAKGKLVNEGEIHAGRYEVPFLFGPNGDQEQTMILVQRDGKWYLFSF